MKSGVSIGFWAFGLACVVSAVSLPLWRALCRRWDHVDDPGHRKIHAQPIPLAGGFAVSTGGILGGLLLWILKSSGVLGSVEIGSLWGGTEALRRLGVLVAGAVGMLALGAWDDRRDLGAGAKFLGQGIIAVLVARWGVQVPVPDEMAIFGQVLTVFWIVAVTNAFNLSDNMNGLSAGLGLMGATAVSVSSFLWRGASDLACGAALIAGSLAGYLPYNYPRASVFLGDAGSQWVGYVLSILALLSLPPAMTSDGGLQQSWRLAFGVVAVPLIDMAFVVVSRTWRGQPFWVGDTQHLSHRLARTGLGKAGAVAVLWVLGALLTVLLGR
jgi:UDP-GlcNAc:undecaprenyl-phosphate/decaprenyl-phosphate GlcNAc-1-phosphate transferase